MSTKSSFKSLLEWLSACKPTKQHFVILALSVGLSAAGIVWARYHTPGDGGRGGAVAVAITFFILFMGNNHGRLLFVEIPGTQEDIEIILKRIETSDSAISLSEMDERLIIAEDKIAGIRKTLKDFNEKSSKDQQKLNCILALASIIGTLAWGFGDAIACLLKSGCWHCS